MTRTDSNREFPSLDCPAGPASPNVADPGGAFSCEERDLAALPGFDAELYDLAVGNRSDTPESRNAVRLLAVVMFRAGATVADCPFRLADHPDQCSRWTGLVRRQADGPTYHTPEESKAPAMAVSLKPPRGDVDPRSLDGWQGDPLDLVGDQ